MDRSSLAPRSVPRSTRSLALIASVFVALLAALVGVSALAPSAHAAASSPCDTHDPARLIYDCAGLLTAAEGSDLEARAQAVQRAGAPVVVYLQAKDATYDQTLQDAADLMARWDVESQSGAKDGLVILLNLTPGNLRHGQVALYAGATLLNGALPQDELNRIYQDVMLPDLSNGQTASGIGAGLDAAATDVRAGHPVTPPPAGQGVARALGTIPLNILAALLLLASLALGLISWRRTRAAERAFASTSGMAATQATMLAPAVAGALIGGRVSGAQMEATILDFARRGLLRIEPLGPKQAQIRLLSDGRGLTGYERRLWQALAQQVVADGVIPAERLRQLAMSWRPAEDILQREVYDRGWLDRDLGRKRAPLVVLTIVSFALAVVAIILGVLAAQPWPFIGAAVCVVAGGVALVFALILPASTPLGRALAQPTRDYLTQLRAQAPDASVSDALPLLVAVGQAHAYQRQLRAASADHASDFAAIYPYWIIMHTSMAPPSSSAGSVAGAVGAAAGGGGAGGAF